MGIVPTYVKKNKKKKSFFSKEVIFATVAATFVFLVTLLLKRPITVELVLAAISWIGFWLIFSGSKKEELEEVIHEEEVLEYSNEIMDIIGRADTLIEKIRLSTATMKNPNTSRRLKAVSLVAEDLLQEAKKDPEMLLLTHDFLSVNLMQTEEMTREYAKLERTGLHDPKAKFVLEEFNETLDLIEDKFKSKRDQIVSRQIENLSISQEVYRESTKLERK